MIDIKRKKLIVKKEDLLNLFGMILKEAEAGVRMLEISLEDCEEKTLEIIKSLSGKRYHFYDKLILRIKNIPYCLFKQPEGIVFFEGDKNDFTKIAECKNCKYDNFCRGFKKSDSKYVEEYIKAVPDVPRELMIEIEAKCNLDCEFCFNKNSFAERGRDIENKLTNDFVKRIIDNAVLNNIKTIRFTGGEPLLRNDIWDLARYAKERNLELRLNSNVLLVNNEKIAERVAKYFDNILIPIHYSDFFEGSEIIRRKIRAIYLLRRAGINILRGGTVANGHVIDNLQNFEELVGNLKLDKWELYRVISTPQNKNSFSAANVEKLIEGLIKIKDKKDKTYSIVNALPFCSYDPLKVRSFSIGAEAVDGHERFAVDPRGFAKPLYYMRENIGNPLDISACWNSGFMKKMRNLEFAPKECRDCVFLEKCKGGCRFSASIAGGEYTSQDPLMNLENKIKK